MTFSQSSSSSTG